MGYNNEIYTDPRRGLRLDLKHNLPNSIGFGEMRDQVQIQDTSTILVAVVGYLCSRNIDCDWSKFFAA